jgi:hypothetical protein
MSSRSKCANAGGRLIAGRGARLELQLDVLGHFALQVAHLVRQAAPAKRARPAFFDRPDDARRAVAQDQQPVGQTAAAHVWKNSRQQAVSSFLPRARCKAPFCRSPGSPRPPIPPRAAGADAPFSNAVDEQIGDFELCEIAVGEISIACSLGYVYGIDACNALNARSRLVDAIS